MPRERARDTIPLYLLGLEDARRTDPLERVVRAGWRYLGTAPNALVRACELAEKEIGAQEVIYEPRVIEAPALQFSALWLHGPAEPYVSLIESDDNLRFNRDLRARIRSAVDEWNRRGGAAGGSKSAMSWNY